MSLIEALILGLIQGLTEFLPVSSSGHLELVKALFGIEIKENLTFTVILHFATALSTIVVFRKEILNLIQAFLKQPTGEGGRYVWFIVLSMIPAVLVGLFLKDQIETIFDKNVLLVGLMLWVTGGLLLWSDRIKITGNSKVGFRSALVMGLVQAIAILPGISRSGSTIASGILMKVSREEAAKFSFLMVVPVILGAMLKDAYDHYSESGLDFGDLSGAAVAVGFGVAFLSGVLAINWMISLVKRSKLKWFALYCFLVGCISIFWHFSS
jgi:undecaprenyl-diphosphatase